MNSGARWMRLFRESFVPVIIVILCIFLMLLYVQFRAEHDADWVTVISIQPVAASISESETADVRSDSEPIVSGGQGSEQQLAAVMLAQGKWPEAEQRYLSILARQRSSRAVNDLGVLYLKKGDVSRALDYFNQAGDADPADTSALFNRALAFSRSGRSREALEGYRALLARQPRHLEGPYKPAIIVIKQGDITAGQDTMEAAVNLAGGERKARALYSLGLAQRGMGEIARAASAFGAAITL